MAARETLPDQQVLRVDSSRPALSRSREKGSGGQSGVDEALSHQKVGHNEPLALVLLLRTVLLRHQVSPRHHVVSE